MRYVVPDSNHHCRRPDLVGLVPRQSRCRHNAAATTLRHKARKVQGIRIPVRQSRQAALNFHARGGATPAGIARACPSAMIPKNETRHLRGDKHKEVGHPEHPTRAHKTSLISIRRKPFSTSLSPRACGFSSQLGPFGRGVIGRAR